MVASTTFPPSGPAAEWSTAALAAAPAASSQEQASPLEEAQAAADATVSGQRTQLNGQILQASLEVSIRAGNDSMALLYRSAVEHINEVLEPELGPNALQNAMQQDNSPEATAGRIVSMSTAFFDAYAKQHPGEDTETLVRNFVDLIRGGFEKGYGEATEILQDLGVMGEDSEIAAGVQKTYDLVMKGYDDFMSRKIAELNGSATQNKIPQDEAAQSA